MSGLCPAHDRIPEAVGAILSKNPNIPERRIQKVVAQVRKNAATLLALIR